MPFESFSLPDRGNYSGQGLADNWDAQPAARTSAGVTFPEHSRQYIQFHLKPVLWAILWNSYPKFECLFLSVGAKTTGR